MDIITRKAWGARYADGKGNAPVPAREVWLHHSVTTAPSPDATLAQDVTAVQQLEVIGEKRFHQGISYTFVVPRSGRVFQGHSVNRIGAHTGGRNSIARAIVLLGNYEVLTPTDHQLDAVAELLQLGRTFGWWSPAALTGGHRDVPGAATECPGDHAEATIGEINRRASGAPPAPPVPPGSRPQLFEGMAAPNEKLRDVQAFLRRVYPSYAGALVLDGRYGPATRAVVAQFQANSHIRGADADGRRIGPRTWAALAAEGYR